MRWSVPLANGNAYKGKPGLQLGALVWTAPSQGQLSPEAELEIGNKYVSGFPQGGREGGVIGNYSVLYSRNVSH